jgi:Alpha/beta hydrolase family
VARFVLVHGAWHGGWCFADVAAELERRGHRVSAPDLPCEQLGLTPRDYADIVGPQPDAVVVGHSLGGQTAALVEARVRAFLGAVLPVEDAYRDCFAEGFGGTARDDGGRSYWPDADTAFERLYPDCTRAQSDWAFAQLRRQAPLESVVVPLTADDVILATLHDAAIDGAWQVRMAREHGTRLLELDAGHFPFIADPLRFADVLESLC